MSLTMTVTTAFTVVFNIFGTFADALKQLYTESGIGTMISDFSGDGWKNLAMLIVACVLIYLAIGRGFEPLLLLPIAFGMLLANLPFFTPKRRWPFIITICPALSSFSKPAMSHL